MGARSAVLTSVVLEPAALQPAVPLVALRPAVPRRGELQHAAQRAVPSAALQAARPEPPVVQAQRAVPHPV